MHSRRGATPPTGAAAASLVAVIALLLIFYIIFIPEEERRELLEGDEINETRVSGEEEVRTLLLANIGKLDYLAETRFDHTISNVFLIETKNAEVLQSFNPFIVKNGWFVTDTKSLTFTIAQPDLTNNVNLVLDAPVREGILTVLLNGLVVYEGRPESLNIPPIELKIEQLGPTNVLEFSVSGVGIAFWKINEFDFSSAQIIGDITDAAKQESTNIITLEPRETRSLEKATLTFFPICSQREVGPLEILLNNRRVSASVPDCGSVNRIELDPVDLITGRNSVVFRITEGSYRVEQIKLRTELEESQPFINYFDLNSTSFDDVQDGRKDLKLKIEFVDDREDKRAEINVNGRLDFIDQKGPTYERDLTGFMVEGNNYVELTPKATLNIVKLEVTLE